jgi:hypothetical protein
LVRGTGRSTEIHLQPARAGVLKLPFRQTYITKQFLGYNNMFMQGYEYNVVDGVAGGYKSHSDAADF